jgi:hypothetical protein
MIRLTHRKRRKAGDGPPPELTASTDKSAAREKAVAVAARAQLGYDHHGREIGPGDGKKPWPGPGSR